MAFERKPLWYKDAVIYEVHVKSYADSDGSGMGDFRGLISRLDYIRDLGVNAIWLLPFYPSPLRDDGYDIADYHTVNPSYGTLEIFKEFLAEAHARDIHVVTEVVINHTSDQHPWFQRARRAPAGSPERDFYVWSPSKEKYAQARIIFTDTEPSNWTWDPVAKSHFWHRFFSHQPDLNFDNPAVHDAVLGILDYWLEMGVDGLRLDAIPYLYEREGTNCENLPETHAFLRKLSAHVHGKFDNRMLLAEANQWPADAAVYFGGERAGAPKKEVTLHPRHGEPAGSPAAPEDKESGKGVDDESVPGNGPACDMAFHFPLMTRLYMAMEMEDRFPIVDILEQTPPIPEHCQWAIFLRNHDELTLEMVTDEERDYMYRVFAKDRRARINVGIRRRLAPLLGNNRRKIELLNKLLLSMPGTPVIYYGDEIGMGDNYYLGDRDGVRTPMQWSADRNAGFSRAPTQRLYLPVIADAENHYEAVNVEIQESNPASLLWWMRRQIRLRQGHSVFGRGDIRFLEPENNHLLAYVRESEEEAILVLANLSQYPQAARLDLDAYRGLEPVELSGGQRFPLIGEGSYPVMLGGHDCLWMLLRGRAAELAHGVRALPDAGEWDSLAAWAGAGPGRELLEAHLVQAPWFEGKNRLLSRTVLRDAVVPRDPHGKAEAALLILRTEYLDGDPEDYSLWIGFVPEALAETLPAPALLARARLRGQAGYLCEAQHLPEFRAFLIEYLLLPSREHTRENPREGAPARGLEIEGLTTDDPPRLPAHFETQLVVAHPEEFRVLLRGRIFLRWFWRLREGLRPDLEVLLELKRRFPKARVPVSLTHARYHPGTGGPAFTLGYTQRFVHAERSARDLAQESLKRFLQGIGATSSGKNPPPQDGAVPPRLDFQTLPEHLQDPLGGTWAEFAFLLGQRLAETHRGLSRCRDADFAPEPFTLLHQQALYHSIRGRVRRALAQLARHPETLPEEARALGAEAPSWQPALLEALRRLTRARMDGQRIRIHGSLRLDRILFTGKDFVFTSFDGPPWLTFPERRFRFSPLSDVAMVLREFGHHAALETASPGSTQPEEAWANHWAELSGGLFLDGYLDAAEGASFLPPGEKDFALLLEAFLIERAAFDLQASARHPQRALTALHLLRKIADRSMG
jgi:maltose alpha-D-glucosyltransferase/alpha-amylase